MSVSKLSTALLDNSQPFQGRWLRWGDHVLGWWLRGRPYICPVYVEDWPVWRTYLRSALGMSRNLQFALAELISQDISVICHDPLVVLVIRQKAHVMERDVGSLLYVHVSLGAHPTISAERRNRKSFNRHLVWALTGSFPPGGSGRSGPNPSWLGNPAHP